MLITFKTTAHANITMFGDVAQRLLEMMDYGGKVPGAIDAEHVPGALENLRRGLAQVPEQVEPAGEADDDQPAVSLHQRAGPLIALLEAAVADQTYVRWE